MTSPVETFKAFLLGDRAYFVRTLGLMPWQDSPLVLRRARCTQGHPIAEQEAWRNYGCGDQHEAYALRRRLMAEIESRAGFSFEALSAEAEEVAHVAWAKLGDFRETIGVSDEEWQRICYAEEP